MKEWLKPVLTYRSYHKNKTGFPFFGPPCTRTLMYNHPDRRIVKLLKVGHVNCTNNLCISLYWLYVCCDILEHMLHFWISVIHLEFFATQYSLSHITTIILQLCFMRKVSHSFAVIDDLIFVCLVLHTIKLRKWIEDVTLILASPKNFGLTYRF